MMYRFRAIDAVAKRSVVFPTSEGATHIPIQGSLAADESGTFKRAVTFIFDPGANGALVVGKRLLDELEIQYEVLGEEVSTAFDGEQGLNQITELSLNIKTNRGHVSFTNVPAVIVDDYGLEMPIDPIIGLQVLSWFTYKVVDSQFEFFVPNDIALKSLEVWEAGLTKGSSVIEPLKPIAEKSPDIKLPEIPQVPELAPPPEWPKPPSLAPSAPRMPTMPPPPKPGSNVPKTK